MKIWFYLVLNILISKIVNGEKDEVIDLESLHPLVLRTLLDLRGVSLLETVPESELINQLLASGLVTSSEIDALSKSPISLSEKIEDYIVSEKDIFNGDVWVYKALTEVQDRHDIYINDVIYLKSILQPYGICTGVFLCWENKKFCKHNIWIFDKYVVQIPGEIPRNIYYENGISSILKSIERELNSTLNVMKDKESLDKWLQNPSTSRKVLLVLPEHAQIPLFFSSLNANYFHHVSFGVVERSKARHLLDQLPNISQDSDRIGRYVVITPTKIYNYGENVNEFPNYKSMEIVVLENYELSEYQYVVHFTIALLVSVAVFVLKRWFQNADESKIRNNSVSTTTTASTSEGITFPRINRYRSQAATVYLNLAEINQNGSGIDTENLNLSEIICGLNRSEDSRFILELIDSLDGLDAFSTLRTRLLSFQRDELQRYLSQRRETNVEMLNHSESNSNESSASNKQRTSQFNEINCVICQYEFSDGDPLKKLRCGHHFHEECIQLWNLTGQHNCPLCRSVS